MNSFGYGGTNSHIVLQNHENVDEASEESASAEPVLFPLSAKNHANLKSVAKVLKQYLEGNPQASLADIAYTLSRKRSHFDYRLSISAQSHEELTQKLQKITKDEIPEGCVAGKSLAIKPRLVFVYSGMGPQWGGMGRELMHSSAVFLETLSRCDQFILGLTGWSLIEELQRAEENSRMEDPQVAQLSNYALQASLTVLMNGG